ncbi:MAG: T9SS type A sorting domain-containing protein [Bacteroidetes bacterium]|nr:T9SS type A sorting domain-containing protein [Bacteroidota bacterium]
MKKIQLTAMAFLMATASFAQTASDFTATDCNSVSHNLYTELNAGKVVVIEWVMPCGACIGGATAAYNAVQSFATSHPGKVVNYLVDDAGNTTCASLTSWATTNGMDVAKLTPFGNSPVAIDEANFGGSGMPHIVVIAPNKTIVLNLFNSAANNQTAITNAINQALTPAGVDDKSLETFAVYPNPTSNLLTIKSSYEIDQVIIKDIEGKTVSTLTNTSIKEVLVGNLATGNYTIQLFSKSKLVSKGTFTKQ